ncbi:zinc finger BED domain-containing protein RICESLEEPER 2-like [Morus notabilis]|uniref:zinc finger BED domain-containing protein RICESLEEPER 2-like n=1 Tax=Morus notabilis TaxID=981085 RepID=UPI000CED778B|nr:zinc finger BED domain-containing protein RICESLEEPER 2-like [Morus notabilis]
MCLTAHYIDSDWKLQKRIINFCTMPNGKGETIGRLIEQCMHGWGLEKVFTVTVDNAAANDSALSYFKRRVNGWKGAVLDGEFLHQHCVAHIVNLIVNEGLKEMHSSITAIQNAVKYVKSSPTRLQKFKDCVKQEKVKYKGSLVLDVPTRWNSTYMMLDVAIKFQKAFDRYEEEDEKFLGYFLEEDGGKRKVGPPMEEDWANAKVFVQFLKTFYEVTLKFSASQHVTSNTFFHEICSIQRQLSELCESRDCLLSTMAFGMRRKFEKYWGNGENINYILFIAVVLDPRYKRDYLRYYFSMVYDATTASKLCKKVDDTLSSLMSFYGKGVDNEKNREMAANTPKERPVQAVNELLSQFLKQ